MAAAVTVAKQLNALLRRKTSANLAQILDAAITTPLRSLPRAYAVTSLPFMPRWTCHGRRAPSRARSTG